MNLLFSSYISRLLTPISRFSCVKSLKYYCKFVIREHILIDAIPQLTLPKTLKKYLLKSPYFDETEDLLCAKAS